MKNGFCGSKKGRRRETPPQTKRNRKHSEERKGIKTQNLADERRTTGRFAKRFSGERPVSLGFELTFLSEFKRVVWRVLDRTAKRCACLFKHPPQCLLKNAIYSMQTLKRIFDIILLSIVYKVSINEQFRDIGFKHS